MDTSKLLLNLNMALMSLIIFLFLFLVYIFKKNYKTIEDFVNWAEHKVAVENSRIQAAEKKVPLVEPLNQETLKKIEKKINEWQKNEATSRKASFIEHGSILPQPLGREFSKETREKENKKEISRETAKEIKEGIVKAEVREIKEVREIREKEDNDKKKK